MTTRLLLFSRKLLINPTLQSVHMANKPNLFSSFLTNRGFLHKSMLKTIDIITDPEKYQRLQLQAQVNLRKWAENRSAAPLTVDVLPKDWGKATMDATMKYGVSYVVLNFANPLHPGGAVLKGGSAQEENMFHRTTCAISLSDKEVNLDQASKMYSYSTEMTRLIEAKVPMTETERELVTSRSQITPMYKTLCCEQPRICFRGPENNIVTSGFDNYGNNILDTKSSFSLLPASKIFPFYELRSAAPDLSIQQSELSKETQKQYEDDIRSRIAAQLDTLILAGHQYVVLGAWGCGEFKNSPVLVAKIYAEEIKKRADLFEHIIFPILNTGHNENYEIFNTHLANIKLRNIKPEDKRRSLYQSAK